MLTLRSLRVANEVERRTGLLRALDPGLCNLARQRAVESIRTPGHVDLHQRGIPANIGWGEVLGWRRFDTTPVPEVVQGWLDSPTHRAVITAPAYRVTGTSIVKRGDYYYLCGIYTTGLVR